MLCFSQQLQCGMLQPLVLPLTCAEHCSHPLQPLAAIFHLPESKRLLHFLGERE